MYIYTYVYIYIYAIQTYNICTFASWEIDWESRLHRRSKRHGHESQEALQAAFQAVESFRALGDRRMEDWSGKQPRRIMASKKSQTVDVSLPLHSEAVSFCISAGSPGMKTQSLVDSEEKACQLLNYHPELPLQLPAMGDTHQCQGWSLVALAHTHVQRGVPRCIAGCLDLVYDWYTLRSKNHIHHVFVSVQVQLSFLHIYIYLYNIHMHVYTYIYMYTHICICIYIGIYINLLHCKHIQVDPNFDHTHIENHQQSSQPLSLRTNNGSLWINTLHQSIECHMCCLISLFWSLWWFNQPSHV